MATPASQPQAQKTVLVQFGNRSRMVNFTATDCLMEKVRETYADQLSTGDKVFLQIQDASWGEFIDVLDLGCVADRSVLRMVRETQQVGLHL